MRAYDKPAISTEEQIRLLASRGLKILHDGSAELFLKKVGYYRFSTYCFPFQSSRDNFFPDIQFETIKRLYHLDEDLRNSIFAAISPLEIFLRVRFVEALAERWGPFAHYFAELFRSDFNRVKWIYDLEIEIARAREPFIEHYRGKYTGFPKLPIWMGVEVMSFGTLSQLYNGLLPEPRRAIIQGLGVPHPILRSWLHFLSYIRNVCAHHSRLWDRELAIRPEIPRKDTAWTKLDMDGTRSFIILPILEVLYRWSRLPMAPLYPIRKFFVDIAALHPLCGKRCGVREEWNGGEALTKATALSSRNGI